METFGKISCLIFLGRQPSMTAFFIPLPVCATLKDTLMSKNNVAALKDTKILNYHPKERRQAFTNSAYGCLDSVSSQNDLCACVGDKLPYSWLRIRGKSILP